LSIGVARGLEDSDNCVYTTVLIVHSWLRWVTLILALGATANAIRPHHGAGAPLPGRWWDTWLMLAVDLQVLVGLALYFGLSPYTQLAMEDFAAAVRNPAMRFWAIEHALGMIGAVVLVRIGRVLALNATSAARARKRRLTCFALATLLILAAMPWPGLANARPLFRYVN
jgi:hypothetical protein